MYPVLFRLANIEVYAYGFLLAIAFVIGALGLAKGGRQIGLGEEKLVNFAIWVMVATIVGARLFYVFLDFPRYLAQPLAFFNIRSGGLSFHGGLIAGAACGLWYTWRHNLPQGKVADLTAPWLALGYAIVRIGCFLNGCCFGRPSGLPWALPSAYGDNTLRHPTQLYSLAAGLIIFIVLWWRRKKTHFNGQLFLEFLFLYNVYRFILEFFRETDLYSGFLTLGQAVSLVGAAAAFVAIYVWPLSRGK
ncbi:MAG: prolipoprotein diacylglyceryl transferase [Firmicutes bacterium]|nr:prolipoprotein diacylglyceryl transferase [Bacillota bacterium]